MSQCGYIFLENLHSVGGLRVNVDNPLVSDIDIARVNKIYRCRSRSIAIESSGRIDAHGRTHNQKDISL